MKHFHFEDLSKALVEIDLNNLKDYKHLPVVRVVYRRSYTDGNLYPRDMNWEVVGRDTRIPIEEEEVRFFTFKAFDEAESGFVERFKEQREAERDHDK
jgi:hypothetical protein